MDKFSSDIRSIKYLYEIENAVVQILSGLVEEYAESDINSHEGAEAADDSVKRIEETRQFLREFLADQYTGNIFNDMMTLSKRENVEEIVRRIIALNDPDNIDKVFNTILRSKKGSPSEFDQLVSLGSETVRTTFFDLFYENTDKRLGEDLLTRSMPGARTNLLGAPILTTTDAEDSQNFRALNNAEMLDFYRNRFSGKAKAGLIAGNDIGRAMVDLIVNAQESIDIGMFQLEHGIILDALARMQKAGTSSLRLMLSPPNKPGAAQTFEGRIFETPQEVGFFNVLAKSLLGDAVKFDEEVSSGVTQASYAHYKFLGVDLRAKDFTRRKFMIGSFNMTRGALGEIMDQSGNLSTKKPNNYELGVLIDYSLVREQGLRIGSFLQMTREAAQYSDWLFGPRNVDRKRPLSNPKHILSGMQTYERLKKSLSTAENVDAYLALNVITKAGMESIDGTTGFFDVLKNKIESSNSTITIFVSKGFHGIRNKNMGDTGHDAYSSDPFKKLMELQEISHGRLRIIETQDMIHAKSAVIYGRDSNKIEVLTGSANVSEAGFGGGSQDVGFYMSSLDFNNVSYIQRQADNVMRYLQTIALGSLGKKSISRTSNASSEKILEELKLRMDRNLLNSIKINPINQVTESGEVIKVGSSISMSMRIQGIGSVSHTFRVLEYQGESSRVYIPEISKIIDPVIAFDPSATVDMDKKIPGSRQRRGTLTVQEFSAASVIVASMHSVLEEVRTAVEKTISGKSFHERFIAKRIIKEAFRTAFRESLEKFENLPLGQDSFGRSFKRLVMGNILKKVDTSLLNKRQIRILERQAELLGLDTSKGLVASILDMNSYPRMSPETMDNSFFRETQQEDLFRRGNGNAPSHIVRVLENGQVVRENASFTLLAQSLDHEGPSSILLTEGLNEIPAFNFNPETGLIEHYLNAAKPDQLAQRLQNMLGSDTGQLVFASAGMKRTKLTLQKDSGEVAERVKYGHRLNMVLVAGLGESTFMNAEAFRGVSIQREIVKRETVFRNKLVNSTNNDVDSVTFMNNRLRKNRDGKWTSYDANTNEFVEIAEGQPLLTIDSSQKTIRTMDIMENGVRTPLTIANPSFGMLGHRTEVMDIKSIARDDGKIDFEFRIRHVYDAGGSMRILSSGVKMVTVGVGGQFFDDFARGISGSIDHLNARDLNYNNLSLGSTYGEHYRDIIELYSQGQPIDPGAQNRLTGDMIHLMVGESIVKTGVVFLQTAANLLRQDSFYKTFLNVLEDNTKYETFKQLLSDISEASEAEQKKDSGRRTLARAIYENLDSSDLVNKMKSNALTRDDLIRELKELRNKLVDPSSPVVGSYREKSILMTAASYHLIRSLSANNEAGGLLELISNRLSGKQIKNQPRQFNFSNPIFLQSEDQPSLKAVAMSNRLSALMPGNQTGEHSQIILMALSRNTSVENRRRRLGELMSIAILGGTAAHISEKALGKGKTSKIYTGFTQDLLPNIMIGGIHFEPLSYTFVGMTGADEASLSKISRIVRELSYKDMSDEEINEQKRLAFDEIEKIKARREKRVSGEGSTSSADSTQKASAEMKMFELMKKNKIGGARILMPLFEFQEYGGQFRLVGMQKEEFSLLSPDTLTGLQGVQGDFSSEIFDLHAEVLKGLSVVRKIRDQVSLSGGFITKQMRDQYADYIFKLRKLKRAIKEMPTDDTQKSGANLIGGFAVIANFVPGFHGLEIQKQAKLSSHFEDAIIMGDEAFARVGGQAVKAMLLAEKMLDIFEESSKEDSGMKINQKLKDKIDERAKRKAQVKQVIGESNVIPFKLETWLLNSTDSFTEATSPKINGQKVSAPNSSVGAILTDFFRASRYYYKDMAAIERTVRTENSLDVSRHFFEAVMGVTLPASESVDPLMLEVKTFKDLKEAGPLTADHYMAYAKKAIKSSLSPKDEKEKQLSERLMAALNNTALQNENLLVIKEITEARKMQAEMMQLVEEYSSKRLKMKTHILSIKHSISTIKGVENPSYRVEYDAVVKDLEETQQKIKSLRSKMDNFLHGVKYDYKRDMYRELFSSTSQKSLLDVFESRARTNLKRDGVTDKEIEDKLSKLSTFEADVNEFMDIIEKKRKATLTSEVIGSFGQSRADMLTLQIHTFRNKLQNSPNLDSESRNLINETIKFAETEISLLDNRLNKTELSELISGLKLKITSSNNFADIKKYQKILRLAQYRYQTSGLAPSEKTAKKLVERRAEDIIYAMQAAGLSPVEDIAHINSAESVSNFHETRTYIKKVSSLLDVDQTIDGLQKAKLVRDMGIAVAYSRAGAPIGPEGGVRSFNVHHLREFNFALGKLGGSFKIDEYTNRRSVFLHMSGMALNLGDFDGDVAIVSTIERYTFLETLVKHIGKDNLATLERHSKNVVAHMKAQGKTAEEIAEYSLFLSKARDAKNNKELSLTQEYEQLKRTINYTTKNLLAAHIEMYLGLKQGSVSTIAASLYGDAYTKGDRSTKYILRNRVAISLNKFASDMRSKAENFAIEEVERNIDGRDIGEVSGEEFEKILTNSEAFKTYTTQLYESSEMLIDSNLKSTFKNIFSTISGSEGLTDDDMLRYAIKVGFASGKLIGNWSNLQAMEHSLATMSRMASSKLYHDVVSMAKDLSGNAKNPELLKEFEEAYGNIDAEHKKYLYDTSIETTSKGFMQRLQQATREAIKPKSSGGTRSVSALEELFTENVYVKAIDAALALTSGQSMFGQHYAFNESKNRAILANVNVNDLIKLNFKDGSITAERGHLEHSADHQFIYDEIIDPMVKAATEDKAVQELLRKNSGIQTDASKALKTEMTKSSLQSATDQGLMYARMLLSHYKDLDAIAKYRSAAEGDHEEHFNEARDKLSAQLKLVFLQEHMRGGRMKTPKAFERVIKDIYEDYAAQGDLSRLEIDAKSIDPIGNLYESLLPAMRAYARGADSLEIYDAVKRSNADQYGAIKDIMYGLEEMKTGENPAAQVSQIKVMRREAKVEKIRERFETVKGKTNAALRNFVGIPILAAGMSMLLGKTASAAEQEERAEVGQERLENHRTGFEEMLEHASQIAFNFKEQNVVANINRSIRDDKEKLISLGIFTGSMIAAHFASEQAEKVIKASMVEDTSAKEAIKGKKYLKNPKGYKGLGFMNQEANRTNMGGIFGLMAAVGAGHAMSFVYEEFMKRDMRTAKSTLGASMSEELAMTQGAMYVKEQELDELYQNQTQEVEVAYDDNGDPIPVPEGFDTQDAENLTNENGESVKAETVDKDSRIGMPEYVRNRQTRKNGTQETVREAAERATRAAMEKARSFAE